MQIAIVGSGSIGQRHVRNIRSLRQSQDDITIIRRKSSTGKVIRDLRAYPDREEFQLHDRVAYADTPEEIPLDKFDLLFVCNPTSFHCEWVLAGLEANVPIFCEKPLAPSNQGLEPFLHWLDREDRIFHIGYQLPYDPLWESFRSAVRRLSKMSPILALYVGWHEDVRQAHPWENWEEGYAVRTDLGGGVLPNYSHDLHLIRNLFGKMSDVRLQYSSDRMGLPVTITFGFAINEIKGIFSQNMFSGNIHATHAITVDFEVGTVRWDIMNGYLHTRKGDTSTTEHSVEWSRNDAFLSEMKYFLGVVDGSFLSKPENSLSNALDICHMIGDIERVCNRSL